MIPVTYFRLKNSLGLKFNKLRPERNFKLMNSQFRYVKNFIKSINHLIKKNPNKKFIIRPHPADIEYLRNYKQILPRSKNVVIKQEGFAMN